MTINNNQPLYWPRVFTGHVPTEFFSTTTYVDHEINLVIKLAIKTSIYTRFFYWPGPVKTHGCYVKIQ